MTQNIALLGCGRIGQVHAASLLAMEGARIAAVADAIPEAAETLAAKTGAPVRDVEGILSDPAIDAVVIGTPTDTHFYLIHAAATSGKAILCEKPIDLSADRIRACTEAIESTGVPFMTAFNRRFDPSFAALARRAAEGEAGEIETISITSRDPAPPPLSYIETSGGLFRDMMIHDLDMARFLLPEEPVSVFTAGAALVDDAIGEVGDVDTALAILTTASGIMCQIACSRRSGYGYDQRIEIHGAQGLLRAGNRTETSVEHWGETISSDPPLHFFLERYADAYRAEMAAFLSALRTGTPPSPDITDGLRAQVLADAAEHSLQTGQPVQIA